MISIQRGFIAILTVITLLAFSLSLTIAVAYLSIGETQSAFALSRGDEALSLTEGCAGDALLQAKRDETYVGGDYSYLNGNCRVDVSVNGTTWTMDIAGTKNNFTRRVEIVLEYTLGPPNTIILTSWLEK
ncbi:MAG: hypothetical protein WCG73_03495 [Candidatus Moraniibacteriota bacterium]